MNAENHGAMDGVGMGDPQATGDPAGLPDFLIIGTTKGGTSSLHQYLAQHPDIYLVPKREVHFFDVHFERGVDWYREQFGGPHGAKVVGEKTPEYLATREAAARIGTVLPTAKLIAILRHPVERAYSHYWMQRSKLPTSMPFEDVIRAEMSNPDAVPEAPHHRYLDIGRYADHLERFDEAVPDAPKLELTMDELAEEPARTFARVCRFLGVDGSFVPSNLGERYNPTRALRSERLRRLMLRARASRWMPRLAMKLDNANRIDGYPPLDQKLREELLEWYRPHNRALAERLDRDLAAWDH